MAKLILSSLIIFCLLSLSDSLPTDAVPNAVETLSNSGYVAMSLTLDLISETLISQRKSATLFSPPDTAFSQSGQPSLSLLKFHFSPLPFSLETLKSLPFGTKIPTFSPQTSLTVTTQTSDHQISINNVTITGSPIYNDGSLIVFGIEDFFDPNFTNPSPRFNLGCSKIDYVGNPFRNASELLKSRGYSVMASFLDLQLFRGNNNLTVFAPVDEVMVVNSSVFLRHVVPCKLALIDLVNVRNGTELGTYLEGFTINVTIGHTLMLNDVAVTFPDMFYSDWLVVHGIKEVLSPVVEVKERAGEGEGGSDDDDDGDDDDDDDDTIAFAPDRGEF